jgi:hypothetical protein
VIKIANDENQIKLLIVAEICQPVTSGGRSIGKGKY